MGILIWIILGGLVGWIASTMLIRNSGAGVVANVIVGLIGGVIGGLLVNLVTRHPVLEFSLQGLFVAVLGAVVFLFVWNAAQRR